MPYCPKATLLWLGLFACLPLLGCGHGSDGAAPPTAALGESAPEGAPAAKAPADSPSPRNPPSDPRHPVVVIGTRQGNVTLQLDGKADRLRFRISFPTSRTWYLQRDDHPSSLQRPGHRGRVGDQRGGQERAHADPKRSRNGLEPPRHHRHGWLSAHGSRDLPVPGQCGR